MASSPKFVCLFFLLTILVCSIQSYARDSQFFSKVTRKRDDATTTTTINPNTNNNYFTNNKVDDFVPLNKQEKKDEQPVFLPQTTETGYGLYGHETGLDAPSTTTTPNSLYNMDENNHQKYENFNNYYKNNNENHEKNYTPELKGLSGTTYTEKTPMSYNNFNDEGKFYEINNSNNDENFNFMHNNEYHHEKNYEPESTYNNGVGKYYGASSRYINGAVEKHGMSDTRFMENGKYYYDVGAENINNNNNNNNNNGGKYYYDVDNVENKYNNGNKENNYYEDVYNNNKKNNNNNRFFNGNGMQEEFDFDQP